MFGFQMNLKELVELEGWRYVEMEEPSQHPDRLGSPQTDPLCFAQACKNNVIAVRPGAGGDAFYAAAHEIAEARHDFSGHHQHVWREQCNILARWCKHLWRRQTPSTAYARVTTRFESDEAPDVAIAASFTP